jgi:hypothetical protein
MATSLGFGVNLLNVLVSNTLLDNGFKKGMFSFKVTLKWRGSRIKVSITAYMVPTIMGFQKN